MLEAKLFPVDITSVYTIPQVSRYSLLPQVKSLYDVEILPLFSVYYIRK